jgi:hypothetical protein
VIEKKERVHHKLITNSLPLLVTSTEGSSGCESHTKQQDHKPAA